ncbi:FMN-linked oxidoreductase [Trichoderma citrinoviride]|uniref:FMN-linked oxidoreductase n=1 Tax=Trichoderma citrinoviride TaxID=58853 RepID=A0A2T4BKG9_9HYPO|nr:FMN-linked oxidoreductase [Trichoderma citrinoviride]PTB69808.1 FMN-linked oxidoreductase [Trichoderma citrinoviride]
MGSVSNSYENTAAPGVPFYTPAQVPPAATPLDKDAAPTLFKPLKIRSLELHNRFVVSPMCQYSADDGHLTDYHLVHLGQLALHGAGLTIVEATAVEPRGRISPQDSGLWKDSQIAPLRRITDFIHSQGVKAGIQIAHAGRKASTLAPWIGGTVTKTLADESVGGWPEDVVAPSPIPFYDDHATPKELTKEEIKGLVRKFAETAERAVKAGFDMIEIHGAHGYLISNFLSPRSNKRTDEYGGSFENRIRFVQEVVQAVRAVVPETMPLALRVSATELMEWSGEPSWTVDDTIRLAKLVPSWGIDILDVSSSGNSYEQRFPENPHFQIEYARTIRKALRADGIDLIVAAVGNISDAQTAHDVVQEGPEAAAELALVARQFLREPEWVLRVAHELKVTTKWPNQYSRAGPRTDFSKKF